MTENEMNHGIDWDGRINVIGYEISEKFHGCRGYWTGQELWSKGGNKINAPDSFLASLPPVPLDTEIYCGYGRFQPSSNAVRYAGKHWTNEIRLMVFDAPDAKGIWSQRLDVAATLLKDCPVASVVPNLGVVTSRKQLKELFESVKARGGEGLMLCNPKIEEYERARNANRLKIRFWP